MIFSNTLAAASGSWQAALQQHTHEQSPDAIRLSGPTWCSSGITIGTTASAYVGDGWHRGQVVATGCTWATIATTRYGSHTVTDRRNLLLVPEAAAYKKVLAKWRRDHRLPDDTTSRADTFAQLTAEPSALAMDAMEVEA